VHSSHRNVFAQTSEIISQNNPVIGAGSVFTTDIHKLVDDMAPIDQLSNILTGLNDGTYGVCTAFAVQ
jgi:hypothetical protein